MKVHACGNHYGHQEPSAGQQRSSFTTQDTCFSNCQVSIQATLLPDQLPGMHLGRPWRMARCLGPCHARGRPRWSCGSWPPAGVWRESVNGSFVCFSLLLCFQVKNQKLMLTRTTSNAYFSISNTFSFTLECRVFLSLLPVV